jgi:hypothetical protein
MSVYKIAHIKEGTKFSPVIEEMIRKKIINGNLKMKDGTNHTFQLCDMEIIEEKRVYTILIKG